MSEQKSINTQIAEAKTADEVNQILLTITTFKKASPGTVRKWDKTARRRLDAISSSPAVEEPIEIPAGANIL
jgi:hypothetical protein